MTTPIEHLSASLQRLHANGHPLGLGRVGAEALARSLGSGTPLPEAAARTGLDPRLGTLVGVSGVADVPAALHGLLGVAARTATHEGTLRTAAIHPLVLAISIALSGSIVFGVTAPALTRLPLGGGPTSINVLLAGLVLACGLLVALAACVLGRIRIPLLSRGWQRIDGFGFVASLQVLVEAGAPLPQATRAAAAWCSGKSRRRGEALARALESGGETFETAPLLDSFEAAMLMAAARSGTVSETLRTLAEHRGLALDREVPDEATRIHGVGLALAGLALLAVGATFMATYYGAVAA